MLWLKRFWPLLLGLLYLASPVDAIPDTLVGLGWADDLVLLLLVYYFMKRVLPGGYGQNRSRASRGPQQGEAEIQQKRQKKILTRSLECLGMQANKRLRAHLENKPNGTTLIGSRT
jgi:uncharacterized membrane protein YkvA (DUF1232 family)